MRTIRRGLVAMANACDSLSSGSSDIALAGGVYVMTGPELHIRTSQAGMLSPEGQCYTFDQRANGFVPGEGVGVVVLDCPGHQEEGAIRIGVDPAHHRVEKLAIFLSPGEKLGAVQIVVVEKLVVAALLQEGAAVGVGVVAGGVTRVWSAGI